MTNAPLSSYRDPLGPRGDHPALVHDDRQARTAQPSAARFIALVLAVAVVVVAAGVAGVLLAFT